MVTTGILATVISKGSWHSNDSLADCFCFFHPAVEPCSHEDGNPPALTGVDLRFTAGSAGILAVVHSTSFPLQAESVQFNSRFADRRSV